MNLGNRLSRVVPSSLLLVCLSAATASAAPVLVLLDDRIATAEGVVVNGKAYDVDFLDGFCADVFLECDASSAFTFGTASEAAAASQALLDEVLVSFGFGPLTQYDTVLELTNGCDGVFSPGLLFDQCRIMTPYGIQVGNGHVIVQTEMAINRDTAGNDSVRFHAIDITAFPDGQTFVQSALSIEDDYTWARWRLRSEDTTGDGNDTMGTVPEPVTPALLGLGLVIRSARRRRQMTLSSGDPRH